MLFPAQWNFVSRLHLAPAGLVRQTPVAATIITLCMVTVLCLAPSGVVAQEIGGIRVAVAANFRGPFETLRQEFFSQTGIEVEAVYGSSGMLYAQIRQGAPYDVFLSADAQRPWALQKAGETVQDPATYALGRLALWMPGRFARLENLSDSRFALANPLLAPYGRATQQCLEKLGLWQSVADKAVYGNNVSQTFQFVASSGVTAGFVALAQLNAARVPPTNVYVLPQDCHDPIEQQVVALNDSAATVRFLQYLLGSDAQAAIVTMGYARLLGD